MSVLLVAFRRLQLLLSICKVKRELKQQVKTVELKKSLVTNNQRDSFAGSSELELGRFSPATYKTRGTCKYLLQLSEEGSLEKCLFCLLLHRQLHKLSAALRFDADAREPTFTDAAEDDVQRARQQASICLRT